MPLRPARPSSGQKQKPVRGLVMRHRKAGAPIDTSTTILAETDPDGFSRAYTDDNAYIDVESDSHGKVVTKITPNGTKA